MNPSQPDDRSRSDSPGPNEPATDSRDTILVISDGPGDTTVRPARHPIMREWPRPLRLPPELEERLRREAERQGLSPDGLVLRLLDEHLPRSNGGG